MGARPPQCDCHCTPSRVDCDFADSFSTTKGGYTQAGSRTWIVSGAQMTAGTGPAFGSFYQSVPIATGHSRSFSVSANVWQNAGVFVGNGRAAWIETTTGVTHGSVGYGSVDQYGNVTPLGTFGTANDGNQLGIAFAEVSPNIFDIAYTIGGGQAQFFETNVSLPSISSPNSFGMVFVPGPSTTPLWDNLTIVCDLTGGCQSYPVVAAVWQVPALPTIGSAGVGAFPCTNCSQFQVGHPMFIDSLSGAECTWSTGDLVNCKGPFGFQQYPVWLLRTQGVGNTVFLIAGNELQGTATYSMPFAQFNPIGSNTFALTGPTYGCATWPPTVTIFPA
jgi:hypothetical protein